MGQIALKIGESGAIPATPEEIRDSLMATNEAILPGYTATLPKSLIEDMLSTSVYAIAQQDQSAIDAVNSIGENAANLAVLTQLAASSGIVGLKKASRTSVYCVFSGVAGYSIPKGFTVGDSTYQYQVQDGGVIGGSGHSEPLYCLATQDGSWAIPAGQVNIISTSVPTDYTLTVTNPNDGTPGGTDETAAEFRARVLRATTNGGQGMTTRLKQLLWNIEGVQHRLVSVKQQGSGVWSVLCGGGDSYLVAGAIFKALFDINNLEGSATSARNITVSITDHPDVYTITYINPPMQTVAMAVTWNTTSTNLVSNSAVQQLAAPALASYINSIVVGNPINLLTLEEVFKTAISSILDPELLTRLEFSVSINGAGASLAAGTKTYLSESESYFYAEQTGIIIAQG